MLRLAQDPVPRRNSDLALADSLVANLCYRRKESYGGIRLFDLLDVIDRLKAQHRLPHPDIMTKLASHAFINAHQALPAEGP